MQLLTRVAVALPILVVSLAIVALAVDRDERPPTTLGDISWPSVDTARWFVVSDVFGKWQSRVEIDWSSDAVREYGRWMYRGGQEDCAAGREPQRWVHGGYMTISCTLDAERRLLQWLEMSVPLHFVPSL